MAKLAARSQSSKYPSSRLWITLVAMTEVLLRTLEQQGIQAVEIMTTGTSLDLLVVMMTTGETGTVMDRTAAGNWV